MKVDREERPDLEQVYLSAFHAAAAGDRPVLLRVESKAGHGAGKPLAQRIEEDADKWTFLFEQLGMGPPSTASQNEPAPRPAPGGAGRGEGASR